MTSPLLGSLATTIGKAFKGIFYPAVLTRDAAGTGDAWNPSAPTPTDYPCMAMVDEWSVSLIAGGLVDAAHRKVLILSTSLAVTPQSLDRIEIRGATLTIVPRDSGDRGLVTGVAPVDTDPAMAVWVCRCMI